MILLALLLHVTCLDCHAVDPVQACAGCHDNTVGAFRENDHPIIPGVVECVSCHDPHDVEKFQVPLDRSQLCLSCHEK